MPTQSSTLAWEIPRMQEPGALQSMGSRGVGHDWANSLSLFTSMHWRRKWQSTPVDCLENPRDGGACWAAVYGVAQSWTQLMWLSSNSRQPLCLLAFLFLGDVFWLPHPVQCYEPPSKVLQALCLSSLVLESIHHLHCIIIRNLI